MKYFLLPILSVLVFGNVNAQEIRYCGQTEATQTIFNRMPHAERLTEENDAILAQEEMLRGGGGEEVIIIPIVFHIIHQDGEENISNAQIEDAVEVLNEDFSGTNTDQSAVLPEFMPIFGHANFEFRLAKRDPNGNCTNGINRIKSPFTDEGQEEMKSLISWPRESYLNVWVCRSAGGAAGYTYLPATADFLYDEDGIVLLHQYTGSIGTGNATRSRALTHEVGHWLNLPHTWGGSNNPGQDFNCNDDDGVADTPNTVGHSDCSAATLNGSTCGSPDNVQNYMEYSYCSKMFTNGQVNRMRSAAVSSVADRNQLHSQQNLIDTGVLVEEEALCKADFRVSAGVVCLGDEITFENESYSSVSNLTWDLGDGTTIAGTLEEVESINHTYLNPGSYTITLTASNTAGQVSEEKENYIIVLPEAQLGTEIEEGFEDESFVDQDWFIVNYSGEQAFVRSFIAPYSGDYSLRLLNRQEQLPNPRDAIISNTFDFSDFDGIAVNYKWAFARRNNSNEDTFTVSVSNNCGETWSIRHSHTASGDLPTSNNTNGQFIPSSNSQWGENTVLIDAGLYLTESVRIKFEFRGGEGNNFYLDDINIEGYLESSVAEQAAFDATMNVYPNPTSGAATVDLVLGQDGQYALGIYDLSGRLVQEILAQNLSFGAHKIELNTSNLAKGMYTIQLQGANQQRITKRLVKS